MSSYPDKLMILVNAKVPDSGVCDKEIEETYYSFDKCVLFEALHLSNAFS